MAKRSVKVNFAYQAGYQVLLILIPLVTTPYLSRTLGAEGVGVFSYSQAMAAIFVMFAMLGMSTYGVREIAAAGEDRAKRSQTFWSAYFSQLVTCAAACAVYACYVAFANPNGGAQVALVWGLYMLSAPLDISWLFFGVEEFKIPTLWSMLTKLATLVVIFGFVHEPDDTWLYCLAISGSFLANQLLIWPFLGRFVDWAHPTCRQVAAHFKPNLVLFVPVIAITVYTSLDKILLGQLAGMQQAGFFEYSEKLSRMPMAIITAMGTVMLPRMTAELSAGHHEEALGLLENSVWAMLAMAMALAFGIAGIAPEFAPVFLGRDFADCDVIMMVLAVIIPVISATNIIGRQYLVPTGNDTRYTASVCVGAVVNVIVNIALIPGMGAMGAAVATVSAEVAVLAVQAYSVRGALPLARYAGNALPFLVIGAVMMGAIRLAAGWFNSQWGMTPVGLCLEVVVGVAVFCALFLAWCIATKDEHFRKLLRR